MISENKIICNQFLEVNHACLVLRIFYLDPRKKILELETDKTVQTYVNEVHQFVPGWSTLNRQDNNITIEYCVDSVKKDEKFKGW